MENVKYIPGDLVKINGVVNIIDGIYPKSFSKDMVIEAHALEGNNTNRYRYDLDFNQVVTIEPILITPEILEKNGWTKDESETYIKCISGSFIFLSKLSNGDWNVCLCKSRLINCKYVHQLQHLLFGLGIASDFQVCF